MLKSVKKLVTEGTCINKIKAKLDKSIVNIILIGWKLKLFPPKSVIGQVYLILILLVNITSICLTTALKKKIRRIQIETKMWNYLFLC